MTIRIWRFGHSPCDAPWAATMAGAASAPAEAERKRRRLMIRSVATPMTAEPPFAFAGDHTRPLTDRYNRGTGANQRRLRGAGEAKLMQRSHTVRRTRAPRPA